MKLFKVFGTLLGLLAMFVFGYAWKDIQRLKLPTGETMLALVGDAPRGPSLSSVQVFLHSYYRIKERYAGEIDATKLKYAAMEGMMASLGDPHTMFLPPKATEAFALETRATFAGVGARLSPDPAGARVAYVFEDGPARRAGLKVGDFVVGVDGKAVAGQDLNDIVEKIRGEPGTHVTLRIQRPGVANTLELRIRRERVTTPTVESKMLPDSRIGLISIASFSEPTGAQFESAITKLEAMGVQGIVIDLRDNPGGLLDTARDLLSHFLDDKVVVKMRGRDGREEIVPSYSGQPDLIRYPVVVLINQDSASAAEIFSGVLRDYRLATLVGEHTFGKAAVQNIFKMADGASAKITIARYLLPSGFDVSRKVDEDGQYVSGGIKPDVEVKLDYSRNPIPGDPQTDNQLQTAIEILKTKIK